MTNKRAIRPTRPDSLPRCSQTGPTTKINRHWPTKTPAASNPIFDPDASNRAVARVISLLNEIVEKGALPAL
jgi:hypothetical protein